MALTGASTSVVDMSGDTTGLVIAKGTTAERDAISSPQAGMIRNNTETDKVEVYNGTAWRNLVEAGNAVPPLTIEYLVVAGGGGGGGWGGGGGAGGLLTSTLPSLGNTPQLTLTVGTAGAGLGRNPGYVSGNDGGDSIISGTGITTITAEGGGGGGYYNGYSGRSGGSGGGGGIGSSASGSQYSGGAGTTGQGNNGGFGGGYTTTAGLYDGGGGGGGAGAVGNNGQASGNYIGGNGGAGVICNILPAAGATTAGVGEVSGADVYYAGGGGGHTSGSSSQTVAYLSQGGIGGGGDGGNYYGNTSAQSGTNNTGGGGGSAYGASPYGLVGAGGSGVIILKYPDAYSISGTGLTSAVDSTSVPGYKVESFTAGTGTITFS